MSTDLPKNSAITDRLLEQVIKAADDWQNVFDSSPDMICILDKDARIIRVNRSFSARLQKPYDVLIGARVSDVIPAYSPPSAVPSTPARTTGQARQEQIVEIGGALFALSLFPCYDTAEELRGAVYIFRDITESKRLRDQMAQSEKMAAIGTLAAEIAHEMNNPLHYINNYLYLLFESLPADFAKKEYLEKIQTGIDNLAQLTKDLLEFSRPQTDPFLPLDLRQVIETSLQLFEKQMNESRIQVVRHYGHQGRLVMGSERMLQRVFENLIQNALDALMPGGSIELTTFGDQASFTVMVADAGSGIAAKNVAKIFEPFFTTKKRIERRGTGLGLAICYNIIKQHNGDIAVSSKEGQGTEFVITLPPAS